MLALELRLDVRARAQQAGEDGRDFDPVLRQFCAEASESPASANLLAQYGARCGTAIFPPMEEIFTMRPGFFSDEGSAAVMSRNGPQR